MNSILFALLLPLSTPVQAPSFDACVARIDPPVPVPTSYLIELRYGHPTVHVVVGDEVSPSLDDVSLLAGRDVEVRYLPRLASREIANFARTGLPLRVFLDYRIGEGPDQTLELVLPSEPLDWETAATGSLSIPVDARGALRYSFRVVAGSGEALGEPGGAGFYTADIAPLPETVLCLGEGSEIQASGSLVPGGSVTVLYDVDRILPWLSGTTYNGAEVWSVVAWIAFEDEAGNEIARYRRVVKAPGFLPVAVSAAAPLAARGVSVWFQGGARGGNAYDSNDDQAFRFTAAEAR